MKLACVFGVLILSPLVIACEGEPVLAPGELDTRGKYDISFKNWSTDQGVGFEFFLFFYDAAGNEVARTETAQFFTLARIEQRFLYGNFTLTSVKTVEAANRIKRMEVVLAS